MNKKTLLVVLLMVGIYIDICLATTAFIHSPAPKLPWFYYPAQPAIFQERNIFENDCWGVEDDCCWWYSYDI
jgi:hypothetical protein